MLLLNVILFLNFVGYTRLFFPLILLLSSETYSVIQYKNDTFAITRTLKRKQEETKRGRKKRGRFATSRCRSNNRATPRSVR